MAWAVLELRAREKESVGVTACRSNGVTACRRNGDGVTRWSANLGTVDLASERIDLATRFSSNS